MADLPSGLLYTEEHEYLAKTDQDDVYSIGVTDYAQGELGDVVFVELPESGESFGQGDAFGTVEAVKAVSDLYMPVAGEVVEVNEGLNDDPSQVNSDPYGDGWMIRIKVSDVDQLDALMDADAYAAHIE
ncbi:MAG: glycine cleavage system protein GcvH [Longimicrobiales bacterium]